MKAIHIIALAVSICACSVTAQADVYIDTIAVGNPGNVGELSGGPGGPAPERICGAVDYTYNIAKYEVTAAQYTEFLNAVAATDTYELYNPQMSSPSANGCQIQRSGSPGSYTYSAAPDWAERPVNYVDWGDAARFSNWLHNGQPTGPQGPGTTEDGSYFVNGLMNDDLLTVERKVDATWAVPSEDEWYKAAYHQNDGVTGHYWDYATGTSTRPGNDQINPDPGNNANFWDDDWTIGSPYYRTEVGEFESSDSPYGTFDQNGNVWEWNEAIIGSGRGMRGGAWADLDLSGDDYLHAAHRNLALGWIERDTIGFRVAEVPEPVTLGMLALGGLLAIRRRR